MTEDEGTGAAQFGGVAGNALVNFYSARMRLAYRAQNHSLITLTIPQVDCKDLGELLDVK
jgi:hypothetical protein